MTMAMKSLLVLILAIIITLYSTSDVALSMTCESRSQDDDCADPQNYFLNYGQLNCTKYYIADGLEAQWTFIRNRDIGLRNKLRPFLYDENNADEFSTTVKSLIELHRSIEKYTTTDSQSEVGRLLAKAVAKQSCEWLNEVGILSADCNDSQNYLPLLEQVHARLDLYDKIRESRLSFLGLYNTRAYKVNYCAWLNDRVLANCQDCHNSEHINDTRTTLSKICRGQCQRRSTTTINLCPA